MKFSSPLIFGFLRLFYGEKTASWVKVSKLVLIFNFAKYVGLNIVKISDSFIFRKNNPTKTQSSLRNLCVLCAFVEKYFYIIIRKTSKIRYIINYSFMRKYFYILLLLLLFCIRLPAQELNASVTVNSDRIQSSNKNIYTTLQRSLTQFINGTKWSNATFANNERIDCTFSLTIMEQTNENSFRAELFIQARRPVFNSSYITTILNHRDTKVEFDYIENAQLEIVQMSIDNNLVAIIAFYCNLILALDFDSFSPFGGSIFYRQALTIAMQAQSNSSWTGWSAFDDRRSRTSIINAFSDEAIKPLRDLWYNYHRRSLDEMAANPDRGRTTILNALPALKDISNVRNSEVILQMFADCKIDEIVSIASKANAEEKKSVYDLLRSVFPTSASQLEPLKK